jgi:hypothetical protein
VLVIFKIPPIKAISPGRVKMTKQAVETLLDRSGWLVYCSKIQQLKDNQSEYG